MALHTLRTLVAGLWIGIVVGLAFLETPLKFLAPGVTLEIALGIGRLVLTAADIASAVLLVALTALSLLRPRIPRAAAWTLGGLWVVLVAQLAVVRPLLNARTDAVLAGTATGGSSLHTLYVAADLLLLAGIVVYVVAITRAAARPRS